MISQRTLLAARRRMAQTPFQASTAHIRPLSTTARTLASKEEAKLRPKSTEGLQPKILNENPPTEDQQSEDVKQHNKEMSERVGKSVAGVSNEDAQKDKDDSQTRETKGDGSLKGSLKETVKN